MSTVARVDVLTADLPFRFSFGHALASHSSTTNVYVRLVLDDGTVGHGEGVPREFVTGETVATAVDALSRVLVPAITGLEVTRPEDVPGAFEAALDRAGPDGQGPTPGARCALELAFLDAYGRHFGRSVSTWLSGHPAPVVQYDAVIPFAGPRKLAAVALAIRLAGIPRVKFKVGDGLERDLRSLAVLRRILGPAVQLRVDANAAWSAEEAITAITRMRRYGVRAVEQPVPADDLDGLRQVTAAVPEAIIVDESLRTVDEADVLARTRACDSFNIRVSKCGGLLNARRIAEVAIAHGLAYGVGAQVGESAILSAAGRHLAASLPAPSHLEGSAGRLLLREDLSLDNVIPGRRGRAQTFTGPGLGIEVHEPRLREYARVVSTHHPAGNGR